MINEDIQKNEVLKSNARKNPKTRKGPVSMSMEGIPAFAHEYMKDYNRHISAKRGKDYTIKQAYTQYFIEKVKEDLKK